MARFWVGGTGNWNDTNHWSTTTGGASGASVPTLSDDVKFDANSFSATGQTVTVNVDSNCAGMDWTGALHSPTFSLQHYLFTHGNVTFISGMSTNDNGSGYFLQIIGNGSYNINFAGLLMNMNITFNDVGTYTLTGALVCTNSSYRVLLQNGTLNCNGQAVTVHQMSCDGSTNTRIFNANASTITCDTWNLDGSNITFNKGTSTIYINDNGTITPNGMTYNIVNLGSNETGMNGTYTSFIARAGFSIGFSSATITTLTLLKVQRYQVLAQPQLLI